MVLGTDGRLSRVDASTAAEAEDPEGNVRNPRIWCWNVNGIRATLTNGGFERFMDSAKPDILCLNETKIDEDAIVRAKVKEQIAKWFPVDLQFWNCA